VETATVQQVLNDALFRLRVSRKEAQRDLQAQVKIGQAIRGQRIRDMRDLDEARREKQEWVQRTIEMLGKLVTNEQWAEQFNDFVPTILPEYAEFGMFVDVFEEEMRHRLGRLHAFLKSLNDVPEPPPLQNELPQTHPEMIERRGGKEPTMPPSQSYAAADASPDIFEPTLHTPPPKAPPAQAPAAATAAAAPASATPATPTPARSQMPSLACGVLIARSADTAMRDAIVQFLQRLAVSLHVIDRQPQGGPASLMSDELARRRDASFALVLTDSADNANQAPDDLFDLGCCCGRLGAPRVFALHRGGDGSTDRFGISHIPIDGSDGWQLQMARLLRKSGVAVDLNRLV
jgi:hypothetical protein